MILSPLPNVYLLWWLRPSNPLRFCANFRVISVRMSWKRGKEGGLLREGVRCNRAIPNGRSFLFPLLPPYLSLLCLVCSICWDGEMSYTQSLNVPKSHTPFVFRNRRRSVRITTCSSFFWVSTSSNSVLWYVCCELFLRNIEYKTDLVMRQNST